MLVSTSQRNSSCSWPLAVPAAALRGWWPRRTCIVCPFVAKGEQPEPTCQSIAAAAQVRLANNRNATPNRPPFCLDMEVNTKLSAR